MLPYPLKHDYILQRFTRRCRVAKECANNQDRAREALERHNANGNCCLDGAMKVRAAEKTEIDHLAKLWFDGWQDAHSKILPAELTRLRTLGSLRDRLQAALPTVRVIGPSGAPLGFCMVKGDELYQLYVSAQARGSGIAAGLMADAEAQFCAAGVKKAWLACAIANERAARFYEKCGWHRVGTMVNHLETTEGPFLLEVWRYEKSMTLDPS